MAFETKGKTFWGFAEILPSKGASRIKVHGEKKEDLYDKSDNKDLKEIFPPSGKVFVTKPIYSYYAFQVEHNTSNKKENGDEYLALHQSWKEIKFSKLLTIKSLANSSSFPLDEIQENWQNIEEGTYFIKNIDTNEIMGPFRKDSRELSPQVGKEVSVYEIPENFDDYLFEENKLLFISPSKYFNENRKIDCMSNNQLQKWFREKVKAVKLFTDSDAKKLKDIIPSIFDANDLDTVRFQRVIKSLDQYIFSYNELKDLFVKDGFEKIVEKINAMRAEIKNEYEIELLKDLGDLEQEKQKIQDEIKNLYSNMKDTQSEISAALEKEKQSLENNKAKLVSELEDLNSTKEKIQSDISEAEKLLTSAQNNYESILLQLQVSSGLNSGNRTETSGIIKPLAFEIGRTGKSFEELQSDGLDCFYLIEKNLSRAGYRDNVLNLYKNENEIEVLLEAHAVFIPCVSWAYIYAQSIGNVKVYTMHIEHDWLHYRDFCKNGLLEIWSEAAKDQETNYILVLEDINLTQPECGMTPLLDLIGGYRPFLESTQFGFLHNIKIFATIIPYNKNENIGLKLSKRLFSSWGTFAEPDKEEYTIPVKLNNDKYCGYFRPDDFSYKPFMPGDSYFGI